MSSKEDALYQYLTTLPAEKLQSVKGNPQAVLQLMIDWKAQTGQSLMDIGEDKGGMIVDEIAKKQPKVMIELGAYMGYSAVKFAAALPQGSKYYSFELNPEFAKVAKYNVELAGLTDKVEFLVGDCNENLVEFSKRVDTIDMAFIDHWKDRYQPDIRLLESLKLIKPGTVITADNIRMPNLAAYVEYMQGDKDSRKTICNADDGDYPGDWNLIYDSKTVKPYEGFRDAVEISYCN